MILTGETWSTGRKHFTAWVVVEWINMEQWWNDTDRRNTNRYKILFQSHITHYKYHMAGLRIQSCSSYCRVFPNYNIQQTYFASMFCFLVLYMNMYIYIYAHTLTHTHTQHLSVSCVCAFCQLQSYYGALCAAHSMHTVRQYKGHFCYTLYYYV